MKEILKNQVSRRAFLGRSLSTFLGATTLGFAPKAFAAGGGTSFPIRKDAAKHVIYLYMSGGMSHLDTFDPKEKKEAMGHIRPVRTNVDDVFISEYLPGLAGKADKFALVRSLTSTAGAHAKGKYLMHTSYEERSTIKHPGVGAWLTTLKGKMNQTLPSSVYVGGNSNIDGGAGFFEPVYEPLAIGDPNEGLKNSKRRGMSTEVFHDHVELSRKLDTAFHEEFNIKQVRAYTQMYDAAIKLMKSEDLAAFDLTQEDERLRKEYGESSFGQGCLLARRLIQHGVRSIEVGKGGWDTHSAGYDRLPDLTLDIDRALTALLNDLERVGKLKDTVVVLTTEFGRTPKIKLDGGRDHYPKAFSSLIAGGPVKGGTVYGKTDEMGTVVEENPVKIPDFNATIAHALGLPLDKVVYSPSLRPFTVANKGKPILDLFT